MGLVEVLVTWRKDSLLFFVLLTVPVWAVVDIAPEEIGRDPGFSGNVDMAYSVKSGNTDTADTDIGGKIAYDSLRRYLIFVQGTCEKGSSSGLEKEDEMLTHARHLYKLSGDVLYSEAFLQVHRNRFKGIEQRWLLGGNLRWR